MSMNPELRAKLQAEREAMPTDLRQAIALETIADRLQLMNEKLTSLVHHAGTISRKN